MHMGVAITLNRACDVIEIPSGIKGSLPQGTVVRIMQSLGSSYTVTGGQYGAMYRIDARDADALGLPTPEAVPESERRPFSEELVWDELKTVFDPEIPVNIVDLGLIYEVRVQPADQTNATGDHVEVEMTLTAPGCPSSGQITDQVKQRLLRIAGVSDARIELVWYPQWTPERLSADARKQLGID